MKSPEDSIIERVAKFMEKHADQAPYRDAQLVFKSRPEDVDNENIRNAINDMRRGHSFDAAITLASYSEAFTKEGTFGIGIPVIIWQRFKSTALTNIRRKNKLPFHLRPGDCIRKTHNGTFLQDYLIDKFFNDNGVQRRARAGNLGINDLIQLKARYTNGKREQLPRYCPDSLKNIRYYLQGLDEAYRLALPSSVAEAIFIGKDYELQSLYDERQGEEKPQVEFTDREYLVIQPWAKNENTNGQYNTWDKTRPPEILKPYPEEGKTVFYRLSYDTDKSPGRIVVTPESSEFPYEKQNQPHTDDPTLAHHVFRVLPTK